MQEQSAKLIIFSVKESVGYWCKLLNCNKLDLLQAIRFVGNGYDKVDRYLRLNGLQQPSSSKVSTAE